MPTFKNFSREVKNQLKFNLEIALAEVKNFYDAMNARQEKMYERWDRRNDMQLPFHKELSKYTLDDLIDLAFYFDVTGKTDSYNTLVNMHYDFSVTKEDYRRNYCSIFKGKGIFRGGLPAPHFWLKWTAHIVIIDEDKALKNEILNRPLYYQLIINVALAQYFRRYLFEVGGENDCSELYEAEAMSNPKKHAPPSPKYSTLYFAYPEIVQVLHQEFLDRDEGIGIELFDHIQFAPIDKPCLGLWELKKAKRSKAISKYRASLSPIFEKIKKAQSEYGEYIPPDESKNISASETTEGDSEYNHQTIDFGIGSTITTVPDTLLQSIKQSNKPKQTRVLLQYWLEMHAQKKEIHWADGFLVFDSWRKGSKAIPKDPLASFTQVVSVLRKIGRKTGLWSIRENENASSHKIGYWKLKNIVFSSNIFAAQTIFDKALVTYDSMEKAKTLLHACEIYPEHLASHLLLVKCWQEKEFRKVGAETAKKAYLFLQNKKKQYSDALDFIVHRFPDDFFTHTSPKGINQVARGNEQAIWEETDTIQKVWEMLETKLTIDISSKILGQWIKGKGVLSKKEADLAEINELISQCKSTDDSKKDRNTAFLQLLAHPIVKGALKETIFKIMADYPAREKGTKTIDPERLASHLQPEIYSLLFEKIHDNTITTIKNAPRSYLEETLYWPLRNKLQAEKDRRKNTYNLPDENIDPDTPPEDES